MFLLDFRLSSIWTAGVRDAFGAKRGQGSMDGLMDSRAYAQKFGDLLAGRGDPILTMPWPPGPKGPFPPKNVYWSKYVLKQLSDAEVNQRGRAAWNALVPFKREKPPVRLHHPQRVFAEAWYHPHGVTLIATARFTGRYNPDQFADAARGFLGDTLSAEWPDGTKRDAKLNGIAAACLDQLRQEAFGAVDAGLLPPAPLHVLTLVRANKDAAEDAKTALHPFEQAAASAIGGQLAARDAADRDIQVLSRGRLISEPDKAAAPTRRIHTLGCLHRNVTVASAQVASLLAGAEAALAAIAQVNNEVPEQMEPYLRQLASQLERVYIGDSDNTYDQACVQRQVRDARTLINRLRDKIPMAPLR